MPRSMHLHTEIYPNLKSISELLKIYIKVSILLYNSVSYNQTLGCFRPYGDSRVSQTQSRINAYEILLQHDSLLVFSRHNRFAETHSHLQLSYHITDRLLVDGNYLLSLHKVMITSGHPLQSSDYLWSPHHTVVITSGHPHTVVITSGHSHTLVITSGHPHKVVIPSGPPHKVVITSGHPITQ